MEDAPITGFFSQMQSAHPNDVAVLFALVAAQEVSVNGIISPNVQRRLWSVELGPTELSDVIGRLVAAGELEHVFAPDVNEINGGEPVVAGFRVVRFEQFQDLMTDFGKRRYNRLKQQERRQPKQPA